jgi:hypothetical protein
VAVVVDGSTTLMPARTTIGPTAMCAFALACQAELKATEPSVQLWALKIEKLEFQIAKLRLRRRRPARG